MLRIHRVLPLSLAFIALMLMGSNCESYDPGIEGTRGKQGLVVFGVNGIADPFTHVYSPGTMLTVRFAAAGSSNADRVLASTMTLSDTSVATIDDQAFGVAELTVIGPGQTELQLHDQDGELVDVIVLSARDPYTYQLLDVMLLGSSTDARVPEQFAIVEDREVTLIPAALDGCGEGLVSIDDFVVEFVPDFAVANIDEVVTHEVWDGYMHNIAANEPGEYLLRVFDADEEVFSANVEVVERSSVDEVRLGVAAAQDNQGEIWGRVFADGFEVIGENLTWSSSERVALSRTEGPNVIATISQPAEGETDDRPAIIEATAFGEDGSVDLFAVTTLSSGRMDPDTTTYKEVSSGGCGGGTTADTGFETCAMGMFFILGLRLRRRR